jgi:glycosyltransferase involved in cell wall biosynthesis
MRVLYFSSFSEPRSTIIRKGLRRCGIDVDVNFMTLRSSSTLRLLFTSKYYDAIIVGEYGHYFVPFAKWLKTLSASTILLFDPYISLYDTMVLDRKLIKATSWKAMYYFLLDKYSCELADICLLDTDADIKFFSKTFKTPHKKFRRVFVGADDDVFHPVPTKRNDDNFVVFWYGTYIPLHGAEYVVEAAKILEKYRDIQFIMVGQGQTYAHVRKLARMLKVSNIKFVNWIEYKDLPIYMSKADVCLGIFGKTGKASRVIPNKVFQALATGKPVITANTLAAREALTHMENAYHVILQAQDR